MRRRRARHRTRCWRYTGPPARAPGQEGATSLASNASLHLQPLDLGPATTLTGCDGRYVGTSATYAYDVTAVDGGTRSPGRSRTITFATATPNQITSAGRHRRSASVQRLRPRRRVARPSTASGCSRTRPLTLVRRHWVARHLAADCSPAVVVTSTLQSPPLGTIGLALAVDVTTADARQRFTLADDIVLRNSGRC